ncbi:transcriptional regulator of NAD metabolism [Caldanaerobacter subterraneus subsp. tengcongensis MB4]|nr:transcriptional regulator of NAD metabolism [Caldanaerobacter subterraneus subsp. tengcongensis MB4]
MHLHTVEAESDEALDRIEKALRDRGFLIEE